MENAKRLLDNKLMISKDKFTEQFASKLQRVRERKKMSQEELAEKAELYRTYVGHLENGRYSPSAYVVMKLARALKIDPSELL